jgi:hypothetical protein
VSCKTTKLTTETATTLSHHAADVRWTTDTVFAAEKDFVFVYINGDTVYRDRLRDRFVYKTKRDTTARTDSVYVEKKVFVEQEKQLSRWQQLKLDCFWWIVALNIALLVFIGIYAVIKRLLNRHKI